MDSDFLGSREENLNRSSSETDLFATNMRPRTCSNLSLRRPSKGAKKRPESLPQQKSLDYELGAACNSSTFQSGGMLNGHITPTREEIKAHAYERLKLELHKAQQELKLKDEQCDKLSRVRNQLESELEELTASLFQEAHAMVHEARLKQDLAEKKCIEANHKVDMLQAEVNALKSLVIARTPGKSKSRHRRHSDDHLSPCEECGSSDCDGAVLKNNGRCKGNRPRDYRDSKEPEVDVITFREFLQFMDELSLSRDQPFLNRIYKENVAPCLEFTNQELAVAVHRAIENNVLFMETMRAKPIYRRCALTGSTRFCQHRVKLADNQDWINICRNSRDRIAAVCDFYTYIRYIKLGLVKADATEIYWEIMRLRQKMNEARLGLTGQSPKTTTTA